MLKTLKPFILLFPFLVLLPAIPVQSSDKITRVSPFKTIVIDPGFGGQKTGASGCGGKVFAKDINLSISKKIAEQIKSVSGLRA